MPRRSAHQDKLITILSLPADKSVSFDFSTFRERENFRSAMHSLLRRRGITYIAVACAENTVTFTRLWGKDYEL